MIAAPPPTSPPAIVRAWSAALNRDDNAAAAKLFAPNARIVQGPLDVRLTSPKLALAFNASLPCAGRIVGITVRGDTAVATFVLGHRPKHTCNAARGEKAAAAFVVRNGRIVLWEQVAVPKKLGAPPA
ncbi:MAG TPA: nuclear transport factor 2 family protein [Gaiellaceae bacterium]|jgi:limonene-1,2-epoxide hydrolase